MAKAKTSVAPPPRIRPPGSKVMANAVAQPSKERVRRHNSSSPDDVEMEKAKVAKGKKKKVEKSEESKENEESGSELGGYGDADRKRHMGSEDRSSALSDEHKLPDMEDVVAKVKKGKEKEVPFRRDNFFAIRGEGVISSGSSNQPTPAISSASSKRDTPSISPAPEQDVDMDYDSEGNELGVLLFY